MSISQKLFEFSRVVGLVGTAFGFGVIAQIKGWWPIAELLTVKETLQEIVDPVEQLLETDSVSIEDAQQIDFVRPQNAQPGLIIVLWDVAPRTGVIQVIDRAGSIIHEWSPNWLEIWPPGTGDFVQRPAKSMFLHGLAVLPDASIVSNFEYNSTIRLDVCGEIVWKLDNSGHHAVALNSDHSVWVPTEDVIVGNDTGFPAHVTPLRSGKIQRIDKTGRVTQTIKILDILVENDLLGLLYMSSLHPVAPTVQGDTMHLNDVEVFPEGAESTLFEPGDLLISLRNINTLLVFDPDTLLIKWRHTGSFVRQHDPDFLKSGRISVFDNQSFYAHADPKESVSRIVEIDPETGIQQLILGGEDDRKFYSSITGSHSRLANGNILVVASQEGRLLEFTADGHLVWRYDTRRSKMKNGRAYNAEVLPPHMDRAFFETAKRSCE